METRDDLRALVEEGVLLTSRALEAGWSRSSLSRRLVSESWTRIRQGAWAEPGRAIDFGVRLSATRLLHPRLVVSHHSAARLQRIETLDTDPPGLVEFIDPALGSHRRVPGVRVHRIPVDPADVDERQGVRVTEVARTLADLLRAGPRNHALVSVESALGCRRVGGVRRTPLVTPARLALALEAPLLGAVRARRWLRLVDRGSGSPAETVARLHMLDAGLRPETQAEVRTRDGRRRYLDFLFRPEGLAVEIEGYAYHGTRDAHRRDLTRFNEIHQCPEVRTLLRYTAETVFYHPTRMTTEIHATLARQT
ncbi:hypothetical protein [Streptomyces blattellae]|uniref:hypothetical protein n=1 Tax=Streptomyces blattellae TaxID=2569855 RepID=UPI001E5757F1|nr:hypothetical protein [Streptomyces blattellae]